MNALHGNFIDIWQNVVLIAILLPLLSLQKQLAINTDEFFTILFPNERSFSQLLLDLFGRFCRKNATNISCLLTWNAWTPLDAVEVAIINVLDVGRYITLEGSFWMFAPDDVRGLFWINIFGGFKALGDGSSIIHKSIMTLKMATMWDIF